MYRRINEDNIWQITKVWTIYTIWWHNTLNSYLLASQFTLNVNIHYSNFTLCIFIWKIKSKESILISSSFHLRLFYRQFFYFFSFWGCYLLFLVDRVFILNVCYFTAEYSPPSSSVLPWAQHFCISLSLSLWQTSLKRIGTPGVRWRGGRQRIAVK